MEPYTLKSGDTLGNLAKANNTTVDALMKLNPNIKDANKIQAGSKLNLTAPIATPAPVAGSSPATTPINPPATSSSAITQPDPTKPQPQTLEQYKASLAPATPAPTAPNYVDTYAKLRADQGITSLEDVVTDDEAQKADLLDQLDKFKRQDVGSGEETKGFATGRLSAAAQNVQDKIDAINRRETISQNNLTTKNNYISQIMEFSKQDYAAANDAYNNAFNQALSIQNSFNTEQSRQSTADNLVVDNARANLTAMVSQINANGQSFSSLDKQTQAGITALEMQAGFKPGTYTAIMNAKPKADMVASGQGTNSTGQDFAWFITKDPATGETSMSKMFTGGVASKTIPGAGTDSTATTKGLPNTELQNVSQAAYDYDSYTNAVSKFGKMAVNAYILSLDPEWTAPEKPPEKPTEKGSEDENDWFSKLLGLIK